MAARHFQLTLSLVVAQRLSDVYGDGAGVINAAHDLPYRQVFLAADSNNGALPDCYVGATPVTSGADYGFALWFAKPLELGPFETGPLKLSDLYVLGAKAGTLHILAIPF